MAGLHLLNIIERSWRSTLPSLLPSPLDSGEGLGDGNGLGDGEGLGEGLELGLGEGEGDGLGEAVLTLTIAFLLVWRILALSEFLKMFEGSIKLMLADPTALALKTMVVMVAWVKLVL